MTDAPSSQYSSEIEEQVARAMREADPLGRGYRGDWQAYLSQARVAINIINGVAQPPTIPVTRETAEPTQYLIDQFREHGAKPSAQRPLDLEVLCHDYAQRWHGEDWLLMDDDDKAELRMEAHRWLKCCSAVSWPIEPAQAGTDPSLQKMQISTRNAVIEECARVADRWGDGEATMAAAEIRMLKTSPVPSTMPLPAADDPPVIDVVRNWSALYLSEKRAIAADLGLAPQGKSSDLEWTKLVLYTAKEAGELPRVAKAISDVLARRASEHPSPEIK